MTLHEAASSLHRIANGNINGEHWTLKQFENYIRAMFRGTPKLGNRIVCEVKLPDGCWASEIIRYADRPDGWDYEIPETREQEARIWAKLLA